MKKFLITLLIVLVISTTSMPVVFAAKKSGNAKPDKPGQSQSKEKKNNGKKDEVQIRNTERKMQMAEAKALFEARKLSRAQLRNERKENLKEQHELVKEYKRELRDLLLELEGMIEEERTEHAEEIAALKLQVEDAQKYQLELKSFYKDSIKDIFPGMIPGETPTEEDIEEVVEVIEDI
jgi:hypothetical protein